MGIKHSMGSGILFAVLAATLYALSLPFSKLLLDFVPPTLMAGLLYLGAGIGMGCVSLFRANKTGEQRLAKAELPYTIAMVVLDIAAPIFLLLGLSMTTAANASLLNNFEIVATSMIALAVFGERISARLWMGIVFVTLSCALLSVEDVASFDFSFGSLFILLACICWGIENNCTRRLSHKDPMQIVVIKGIFSGLGSIAIGLVLGESLDALWSVLAVLAVGFISYGMSIFFYVYAQRLLGAARTSAYYAITPFIGALLSLVIFRDPPTYPYFVALALMIVGAWLCAKDEPLFEKKKKKIKIPDGSSGIFWY